MSQRRDSRGRFASSTHTAGRRTGLVTGSFKRYRKRQLPEVGFDDNVTGAHAEQRAAIAAVRRRYAAQQKRRR